MADQIFNVSCGFFDAVDNDRLYTADQMNMPYKRIVANGVFAEQDGTPSSDLQVSAAGAMNISVAAGEGVFAGKWFKNPSAISITVPSNSAANPRIDSVIVQIDNRMTGRAGNVVFRQGTPSATPEAPAINTETDVIEYRVANVYVGAGATSITNANITDTRGTSECLWVTSLIQQVDTSTLFQQWQSAFQSFYNSASYDFARYTAEQREAWQEFIDQLTEELSVTPNVVTFTSTYDATGTVVEIPIGIASFDPATDVLLVYINGLLGVGKYTVTDASKITLTNAIGAGDSVYFVCFKSLVNGNIDSAVSLIQSLDDKVNGFMSDSGWIVLSLQNSAQSYDSDSVPAIRCIGNRVYLRGSIKNVTSTDTAICTLPDTYRPAQDHVYSSSADASSAVNRDVTITISATDGTVKISAKSGMIADSDRISLATSYLSGQGISVSAVYKYKGSVSTYADLPSSGMVAGDVYMIQSDDIVHNIVGGDDVLWNGVSWELLDSVITSAEIDEIIDTIE